MTDADSLYYMRARYYDPQIKRFINRDVVSGGIENSQSLNRYCYVQGNPVNLNDPFGLCPDGNAAKELTGDGEEETWKEKASRLWHRALDIAGIFWDVADLINCVWYIAEKNPDMAVISGICALPFVGNFVGGSAGLVIRVVGRGLTVGLSISNTAEAIHKAYTAYKDGNFSLRNVADIGINAFGLVSSVGLMKKDISDWVKPGNPSMEKLKQGLRDFATDNRGCVDIGGAVGKKNFTNPKLLKDHYNNHGTEIARVLEDADYTMEKYLEDANYIINNGVYVPERHGYVSFMKGKKYGFVGLNRNTGDITTFHIKDVKELMKIAPSLGFEL